MIVVMMVADKCMERERTTLHVESTRRHDPFLHLPKDVESILDFTRQFLILD